MTDPDSYDAAMEMCNEKIPSQKFICHSMHIRERRLYIMFGVKRHRCATSASLPYETYEHLPGQIKKHVSQCTLPCVVVMNQTPPSCIENAPYNECFKGPGVPQNVSPFQKASSWTTRPCPRPGHPAAAVPSQPALP